MTGPEEFSRGRDFSLCGLMGPISVYTELCRRYRGKPSQDAQEEAEMGDSLAGKGERAKKNSVTISDARDFTCHVH